LEFVEHLYPDAEAIESSLLNHVPVEFVLVDKLQDEFLLLVGARPAVGVTVAAVTVVTIPAIETVLAVVIPVTAVHGNPGGSFIGESVFIPWDESGLLDFAIHRILEEMVDPCGLALNVSGVGQLGLDGDAELVTGIAGKAESFGVIAD